MIKDARQQAADDERALLDAFARATDDERWNPWLRQLTITKLREWQDNLETSRFSHGKTR